MNVRKKNLSNGLTVVSELMPNLRSAAIGVWIKGGSRHEDADVVGISHFIEHLLFKGTRTRTAADIAQLIDSVGGQLNAFTEKEYVGFYAKVLDCHLPAVFELLSDIILHPAFPPHELKRERNVIFEEINMVEDSPQDLIQDLYLEHFWNGHPLGRPISGTKESVAGITRRQVKEHFVKSYTARNTLISIAGNIRHEAVLKLAQRHFGALERGRELPAGPPPTVHAGRVIQERPNLEQTHICLGIPSPPLISDDRYCAHVLSNILGGGMSSRLFQNVREKRGLVYSIYSTLSLYCDAGALTIYAGSAHDAAERVVELILKELRLLRSRVVGSEELKRNKESIKGAIMLGLESSSSRMMHLAQQEMYFGRICDLGEILKGFDRVSERDVLRLANEMFDSSSLTLTGLAGERRHLESVAMKI
jgi:predicted Zn-dependent peptidase